MRPRRAHAFADWPSSRVFDAVASAVPGFQPVECRLLESGHANTNYQVISGAGRSVLLRIFQRDLAAARREPALHRLVRDLIPVPEVRFEGDGWSVYEWLEGELLDEHPELAMAAAHSIGLTLARIGTVAFEAPGFLDVELNVSAWEEACEAYIDYSLFLADQDLVRERGGEELVERAKRYLESERGLLDPYRGSRVLVHSDYKPRNLLVREGAVSGVLDWEFAHSGAPILDVGILMRHIDPYPPGFGEAFANGFREGGGFLGDRWREAAAYVDLCSLLDFLNRAETHPEMIEWVISRLEMMLGVRG